MGNVVSNRICAVVIITVAGELTFDLEVFCQTLSIAHWSHLSIADSREGVCCDRETSYPIGEVDLRIRIDECHLRCFIIVLIMHVVDDIHRVVVDASNDLEHLEIVIPDLIKVKDIALEFGDTFDHERTRYLAAATIDR